MMLSTVTAFTYDYVAHMPAMFVIYLALTYFVTGSTFVSMPILFAKVFGPEVGSQAYSYFFTANSLSSIALSLVVE